jgi:hypothetical protein
MFSRAAAALFGLLLTATATVAAPRAARFLPVDEAGKDPSFVAFRNQLRDAVRRRDSRSVMSVVDPKIEMGFDGNAGIGDFKRIWKPERKESDLWPVLDQVLAMGGTFEKSNGRLEFCAPYVASRFPAGFDEFESGAITGKDVRVYARPQAGAAVAGTLSYDVVKVIDWRGERSQTVTTKDRWVLIRTPQGLRGYVRHAFIRSPVDFRAYFAKVKGRWMMVGLIAGD